jgi:hypothetical protein
MASRPPHAIAAAIAILGCLLAVRDAGAQAQPQQLTLGIYTPSVEFGTAQARLAYAQGVARAIEQATGIKTTAQSYATFGALEKDKVDLAIIDAQCAAVRPAWKVVANASIAGATARTWALYSTGGDMEALRGKRLAYVATGCNDAGFLDHAMLESEVDAKYFAARLGEKDLTGAIASVTSYKTAQAVFAPVGSVTGASKLFDTIAVPNPAFVEVGKLPAGVSERVAAAVVGYGGSGAIAGWTRGVREPYQVLAARLARVAKIGMFAAPEPVRIDARDVLVEPTTLRDHALVGVRHHFVRPAGQRLD